MSQPLSAFQRQIMQEVVAEYESGFDNDPALIALYRTRLADSSGSLAPDVHAPDERPVERPTASGNGQGSGRAPVKLVTEKQLAFIRSLLAERGLPEPSLMESMTAKGGSDLISDLLKIPKVTAETIKTEIRDLPKVTEGYYHDGTDYYHVRPNKEGTRLYAMVNREGKWGYAKGAMRSITPDMRITLDQARAYGLATGRCFVCGRELTNPKSVEYGIGPICAGRFET